MGPVFHFLDTNCSFNLPEFTMNLYNKIQVGTNLTQTLFEYIPYTHCTNSLFMLNVHDKYNVSYIPEWVDPNILANK